MALVFAKFLNPKQNVGEDNNASSSSNHYFTQHSVQMENAITVVQSSTKGLSSDPIIVDSDAVVAVENFGREELSLGEIDELVGLLGVTGDEDGLWCHATLSFSIT
ncbi:hypothetical protein V8G54_004771 [Vigna mungo]|uniref:Uncharacterized protein n=1 Tax=Vigna mungo TaxID=3915 RepID=A0AAQ3PHX2_VIGMU